MINNIRFGGGNTITVKQLEQWAKRNTKGARVIDNPHRSDSHAKSLSVTRMGLNIPIGSHGSQMETGVLREIAEQAFGMGFKAFMALIHQSARPPKGTGRRSGFVSPNKNAGPRIKRRGILSTDRTSGARRAISK